MRLRNPCVPDTPATPRPLSFVARVTHEGKACEAKPHHRPGRRLGDWSRRGAQPRLVRQDRQGECRVRVEICQRMRESISEGKTVGVCHRRIAVVQFGGVLIVVEIARLRFGIGVAQREGSEVAAAWDVAIPGPGGRVADGVSGTFRTAALTIRIEFQAADKAEVQPGQIVCERFFDDIVGVCSRRGILDVCPINIVDAQFRRGNDDGKSSAVPSVTVPFNTRSPGLICNPLIVVVVLEM